MAAIAATPAVSKAPKTPDESTRLVVAAAPSPHDRGYAAFAERDYAVALRILRPRAQHGEALAQYCIGVMYEYGEGADLNYATALKWYREAADQGFPPALTNLAEMYRLGEGVAKDPATAVLWLRRAADKGCAIGQHNLATMYFLGEGVPQDYVQAHLWYNLSAASGFENAQKARDMVAAKMTFAQIAEAQLLASRWRPTAATR